jgi:hypothetical protein
MLGKGAETEGDGCLRNFIAASLRPSVTLSKVPPMVLGLDFYFPHPRCNFFNFLLKYLIGMGEDIIM